VSYIITDIDGTLTTSGDTPRQDYIDWLKQEAADDKNVIIVSARPISRLDETRAWLDANDVPHSQIHLNDFAGAGQGPNVGLEFKRYKYDLLVKEYGVEDIEVAVDNDADVRAMARELGLEAMTPQEAVASMEMPGEDDPTANNTASRVVGLGNSAEAPDDKEIIDVKELETRSLPLGDFSVTDTEDGQKTFSGYAALFNTPSDGMQFTEIIAPSAFTRTLKRVADGKKMISFLFGHDETRALATTASGRLTLTEDARGLKVSAKLDPADPDAASVISKLTHEALSMGMSFGFSIPKNGDEWTDESVRTLKEINLFEVSVLSAGQTPAYPATIGLTAVRKVSADKLGVDGDRLMTTLENIKSATPLTEDDVQVLDQVRERLAPSKPVGVDPTVALALLQTKRLIDQEL
jgi:HK97 family phage prohead protease